MINLALRNALVLLACASIAGCAAGPAPRETAKQNTLVYTAAQRADPGYTQYLERQSMLGSDLELARIVSGSQLAWMRPAGAPFPGSLLVLADTWLSVHPLSMLPETKRSVFASLASAPTWQVMDKTNIRGMHIAPTGAAGSLWAYGRNATMSGDDVIQYTFSETAGQEEDYRRLLDMANSNRRLLGLDLVPASTGLGPDFFLATRNHRQFPGVYCLVELPQNTWAALPPVTNQWRGTALTNEQVASLAAKQLLPPAMEQDKALFGTKSGWAVTGEVHGVDGLMRRWAYRFYGSPDRPILNWEDPSTAARRVISGSVIRNVGVLGAALVGMRLEGLYGLDAVKGSKPPAAAPADEAAIAISREVRRYGGWAWLRDELPLAQVQALMPGGPDFLQDSVFSPGVEHALLTGNAALLRAMTDEALRMGIDMRRLVHAMPGEEGVKYDMPHLAEVAASPPDPNGSKTAPFVGQLPPHAADALRKNTLQEMRQVVYAAKMSTPKGDDIAPVTPNRLYTTAAGIAALALGAGNADSVPRTMIPQIQNGHLLLTFFRAMQPGLFMLSGQDLAGTLPLSWYSMIDFAKDWDISLTSRGAYPLSDSASSRMVTSQGIAKGKTVYAPADIQVQDASSFASKLGQIIGLRNKLKIAGGTLLGRFLTRSSGTFALAVLLPSDGRLPGKDDSSKPTPKKDGALFTQATLSAEDGGTSSAQRLSKERENDARVRAAIAQKLVPAVSGGFEPGNAALITVYNFSRERVTEVLNMAATPTLARILNAGGPVPVTEGANIQRHGNVLTVTLNPWQGVALVIGKMP